MIHLSRLHMTTGKIKTLTRRTFVSKLMSLLSNTLSRFVTDFLPRSKCLFISWLQSPYAVILEPLDIKKIHHQCPLHSWCSFHPRLHLLPSLFPSFGSSSYAPVSIKGPLKRQPQGSSQKTAYQSYVGEVLRPSRRVCRTQELGMTSL